ncbi:5602_t:CDS:2 [Cetraspora pellucida]|uniref:5602_t:CDS:1 n=1 Tax=Cetraspora pellucida TaxID=1433469 RepID=A0A9N9FGT4_9GLOM|nr:5602_t:CDS:2 [Cetraspora pellucida]
METHSELETLNDELNELYELEEDQEDINNVFTMRQIEEFKKIYAFKPVQASIKKKSKFLVKLEKQDDEAYLKKLKEKQYCQKNCVIQINTQDALNRYREIKAISQAESNFCFLGMIDASARFGMLNNKSKSALRSLPSFLHPGTPNLLDLENYISWDFAKCVQIPYFLQQEGTIYFKSPYKIQVFGVCEKGTP